MCIDIVIVVCFFLVKMLRKEKFFLVYGKFIFFCKVNKDKKRYSDCLIVEVYCIFFYCVCYFFCLFVVVGFREVDRL